MNKELKSLVGSQIKRLFDGESVGAISSTDRTVEFSFASNYAVDRGSYIEQLDVSPEGFDLSRLNKDAAVLLNHNTNQLVGVVNRAWLDGNTARVKIKLSRSTLGNEVLQDVEDGVRKLVSFAATVVSEPQQVGTRDGKPVILLGKVQPYEVSFVSVPADPSVGIGRALDIGFLHEVTTMTDNTQEHNSEAAGESVERSLPRVDQISLEDIKKRAGQDARRAELQRIGEIRMLAQRHAHRGEYVAELAEQFINREGGTGDQFQIAVLERLPTDQKPRALGDMPNPDLGLTEREIKRYSFMRLIRALASPHDRHAVAAAAFELECSAAASSQFGKTPNGAFIPFDVMTRNIHGEIVSRDQVKGTATLGGNTVATNLLASSFIDLLKDQTVLTGLGVTYLNGLVGDVALPRKTGATTAAWVAESNAASESQMTFDQVTMSPKTVTGNVEISRKILLQSSLDMESEVRRDLAQQIALALEIAAVNGTGSGNQPRGILNTSGIGDVAGGTNGAAPTYDHMVDLETAVAVANAAIGNLGYLSNAKVRGKLKKTFIDGPGTGIKVWMNNMVNDYPASMTNYIPSTLTKGTSSGNCSAILFGNWVDMLIGMWGTLDVIVNPYALDTQGGLRITALMDCDIALRRAASFAAMKDALAG